MAFNGTEGGIIPLQDATAMTAKYRRDHAGETLAHFFGRDILLEILNQENCVGIRMYYGQKEDGTKELVIVGADSEENDLLDLVADFSAPCPGACSNSNVLNS